MFHSPGDLIYIVDIRRPPTGLDSRGQITGTATTIVENIPAGITMLTGLERIRARKIWPEAQFLVTVQGDPDTAIQPQDYVVHGSRTLHIGAVIDEDQRSFRLTLLCAEEV